MVKLRAVEVPGAMAGAPNAFWIAGGWATTRVAVADVLDPSSKVACTALVQMPRVIPVTFTFNTQDVLASTMPPLNETVFEPAVARRVAAAHPGPMSAPLGVATTRPAGKVSVKAMPGGCPTTRPAVAVLPVLAFAEVTVTALVNDPARLPRTVKEAVNEEA
jgi:hypothetical protein